MKSTAGWPSSEFQDFSLKFAARGLRPPSGLTVGSFQFPVDRSTSDQQPATHDAFRLEAGERFTLQTSHFTPDYPARPCIIGEIARRIDGIGRLIRVIASLGWLTWSFIHLISSLVQGI